MRQTNSSVGAEPGPTKTRNFFSAKWHENTLPLDLHQVSTGLVHRYRAKRHLIVCRIAFEIDTHRLAKQYRDHIPTMVEMPASAVVIPQIL